MILYVPEGHSVAFIDESSHRGIIPRVDPICVAIILLPGSIAFQMSSLNFSGSTSSPMVFLNAAAR